MFLCFRPSLGAVNNLFFREKADNGIKHSIIERIDKKEHSIVYGLGPSCQFAPNW
jgi:hypothetical protein